MKCPICKKENTLTLCFLYQCGIEHKITKKGLLSKKYKRAEYGSEEVAILTCESGCNVNDLDWDWDWNTRKFFIENSPIRR